MKIKLMFILNCILMVVSILYFVLFNNEILNVLPKDNRNIGMDSFKTDKIVDNKTYIEKETFKLEDGKIDYRYKVFNSDIDFLYKKENVKDIEDLKNNIQIYKNKYEKELEKTKELENKIILLEKDKLNTLEKNKENNVNKNNIVKRNFNEEESLDKVNIYFVNEGKNNSEDKKVVKEKDVVVPTDKKENNSQKIIDLLLK